MTDFPSAGEISDNAQTEGAQKIDFEAFLAATKQLPGGLPLSTIVITGGVATPDRAFHAIDSEGLVGPDDLDRLDTLNTPDGRMLWIQVADTGRPITVRHAQGGTGQISLVDSQSFVLDTVDKLLALQLQGTTWVERWRAYGNQAADFRAFLGLAKDVAGGVQSFDANTAKTNVAQVWTRAQAFGVMNLVDAASIAWNLDTHPDAEVELGGSRTLANPTNKRRGVYVLTVRQDATGSRTLAFDTDYKFPGGSAPTLTSTPGAVDILTFKCDGAVMNGQAALDFR